MSHKLENINSMFLYNNKNPTRYNDTLRIWSNDTYTVISIHSIKRMTVNNGFFLQQQNFSSSLLTYLKNPYTTHIKTNTAYNISADN